MRLPYLPLPFPPFPFPSLPSPSLPSLPLPSLLPSFLCTASLSPCSSNVVEKTLKVGSDSIRRKIVEEMCEPSALPVLLHDHFANYCIQTAIQVSDTDSARRLVDMIRYEPQPYMPLPPSPTHILPCNCFHCLQPSFPHPAAILRRTANCGGKRWSFRCLSPLPPVVSFFLRSVFRLLCYRKS